VARSLAPPSASLGGGTPAKTLRPPFTGIRPHALSKSWLQCSTAEAN